MEWMRPHLLSKRHFCIRVLGRAEIRRRRITAKRLPNNSNSGKHSITELLGLSCECPHIPSLWSRDLGGETHSREIFSFHLASLPLSKVPGFLMRPAYKRKNPGLNHSESFFTMNLGEPILAAPRYNFTTVAFFAWWSDENVLEEFLEQPSHQFLNHGWHVRMKLYRRWGEITELKSAIVDPELADPNKPVVAVTLARLKLSETVRFAKWGRPVESQVRNHAGKTLALAAIRPLNTFSTFSIWRNESEMLNMVSGRDKMRDGESHKLAMQERVRKDFHHEFSTMRFTPFKEVGIWNGKSNYT